LNIYIYVSSLFIIIPCKNKPENNENCGYSEPEGFAEKIKGYLELEK